MCEQLPSYYAILTPEVRYNKKLKPIEKIVFAEITALSNLRGYCFATNDYLANLYDVDSCTISRYISHLEKLSLIKCEYIKEGQIIKERRIYINVVDNSVNGTVDNSVNGTVDNSVKENNTRVNNTSINNIYSPEKSKYVCNESVELCEKLLNYCKNENPHFSTTKKDKWTEDIGKIHFIDGYSWEDIGKVIDFAKTDNFWKANILSGDKLRKQMQRLYLQTSNKNQNTTGWQNSNSYQSNQEEKSCL